MSSPLRSLWSLLSGLLCLALSLPLFAQSPSLQRKGREIKPLDTGWYRKAEASGVDTASWATTRPPDATATNLSEPPSDPATRVVWRWKEFPIPKNWKAPNLVRLQFGGVLGKATIWVNGAEAGRHSGGAAPFIVSITRQAKLGASNLLAVRVEGRSAAECTLGGQVSLLRHDEAYLEQVFPQGTPNGLLEVPMILLNTSGGGGDAELEAAIYQGNNRGATRRTRQILHLAPNVNVTSLTTSVPAKGVKPWSPDSPALYTLKLALRQGQDILDTLDVRFGFRRVGWKNGSFAINNAPITLAPYPLTKTRAQFARADVRAEDRTALQEIKGTGYNFLFLESPVQALVNALDEIGALAVVGSRPSLSAAEEEAELKALIARYAAHPCLVAWVVRAGNGEALRRLDSTRPLLVQNGDAVQLWLPDQPAPSSERLSPELSALFATR